MHCSQINRKEAEDDEERNLISMLSCWTRIRIESFGLQRWGQDEQGDLIHKSSEDRVMTRKQLDCVVGGTN